MNKLYTGQNISKFKKLELSRLAGISYAFKDVWMFSNKANDIDNS
jgi:hypothetical protein